MKEPATQFGMTAEMLATRQPYSPTRSAEATVPGRAPRGPARRATQPTSVFAFTNNPGQAAEKGPAKVFSI